MELIQSLQRRYEHTTEVFANGNQLIHFAGDYPISSFRVLVPVGSFHACAENGIIDGLPHFFEHMMMARSQAFPGDQEFVKVLGLHGGSQNASTGYYWTNYRITIPSEHAELGQRMLADRVFHPLFTDKDLVREKGVIATEREGRKKFWPGKSQAAQYYYTEFIADDSIGWKQVFGDDADFEAITVEVIRAEHQRQIAKGGLVGISIGPVYPTALKEALQSAEVNPDLPDLHLQVGPCVWKDQALRTVAFPSVRQPVYEIAWLHQQPFSPEDRRAIRFMLGYLTNNVHGVLWDVLRIEKGLIYSLDYGFYQDLTATIGLSFPLRDAAAVDQVREILPGLLHSFVTNQERVEAELTRALAGTAYWAETAGGIISEAANEVELFGAPVDPAEFVAAWQACLQPQRREYLIGLLDPALQGEILFIPE
jgi:predicted Zn-dependent peptidase